MKHKVTESVLTSPVNHRGGGPEDPYADEQGVPLPPKQ